MDKETVIRGVGRTVEERTFIESEGILSMLIREDKQTEGAKAFLGETKTEMEGPRTLIRAVSPAIDPGVIMQSSLNQGETNDTRIRSTDQGLHGIGMLGHEDPARGLQRTRPKNT